jgi:hypothetical protein
MTDWFKRNSSIVWSWAALIGGSLIIFWASLGTRFQQFAIGLLTASIALLVIMAVFEALWQTAARAFNFGAEEEAPSTKPKSRNGRR